MHRFDLNSKQIIYLLGGFASLKKREKEMFAAIFSQTV